MDKIRWNRFGDNDWYSMVYFMDSNMFLIHRRRNYYLSPKKRNYFYRLSYLHNDGWKEYATYTTLREAKERAYNLFCDFIHQQNEKNKMSK